MVIWQRFHRSSLSSWCSKNGIHIFYFILIISFSGLQENDTLFWFSIIFCLSSLPTNLCQPLCSRAETVEHPVLDNENVKMNAIIRNSDSSWSSGQDRQVQCTEQIHQWGKSCNSRCNWENVMIPPAHSRSSVNVRCLKEQVNKWI